MRVTAAAPAAPEVLYRELIEDARLADELGLHSLWLSEHHGWYDGWCPSLLVAGAAVLAATERLHVGTSVFLLPLHDPVRVSAAGRTLRQLAPGRLELGVGLGYRDAEFDAVGVSRRKRGRRADMALDLLSNEWAGDGACIWIGGFGPPALERAASRGLSLLLPSSMRPAQLRDAIERARDAAAGHGTAIARIGMLKDAWITDGSAGAERAARAAIGWHVGEYGGAFWALNGQPGFEVPQLLKKQVSRTAEMAVVGSSAEVAEDLHALEEVGVDLVILQVAYDFARPQHRDQLQRIATEVVPALT